MQQLKAVKQTTGASSNSHSCPNRIYVCDEMLCVELRCTVTRDSKMVGDSFNKYIVIWEK